MSQAILSLGSNLGNRVLHLNTAISRMEIEIGGILAKSSIFESESWGFKSENTFLNQVVSFQTELNPEDLLKMILKIENDLGRIRISDTYESRTIDLDILFFEDRIIEKTMLQIPHPRISERKFVLMPLNEIMTNFIHPISQKSIKILLDECWDKLWVKKFIR